MRIYGPEYTHLRPTTPRQRHVIDALASCRTPELGGYVSACDVCDYRRVVYNPCRDRHCPSCEGQAAEAWLSKLRERILPCRYFHVVFTLPSQLRWLAFHNARLVYGLLLKCAGETLQQVASDKRHLGAQLGITTVLHTWTRTLQLHPHVHCVVTGGGLSPDGERWIPSWGERYLAPNRLLAARFRDMLLRRLQRAHRRGKLRFGAGCAQLQAPAAFAQLRRTLGTKPWLVYSKATFKGLQPLLRYLARYTHRVGISDRRILDVHTDWVTFATKNGGTAELEAFDFLSRFLLHVLPHGFVKIRHYGLFSTPMGERRERARQLLAAEEREPASTSEAPSESDPEVRPCPACLFGILEVTELLPPTLPDPFT